MMRCAMCGWALDDEHVFNVRCAVANAENDQIEAEVMEARAQPLTPEDAARVERLVAQGMDVLRDVMALKEFERIVENHT